MCSKTHSCDETKSRWSFRELEYQGIFSTAMKIRSTITYILGRIGKRGNIPWQSLDGIMYQGNPSISMEVSTYISEAEKRKVFPISFTVRLF